MPERNRHRYAGARRGRGRLRALWLGAFLVSCLVLVACSRGPSPPTDALHVGPCTVQGRDARCGTLTVPEDRVSGEGRTIPVSFVVVPATGSNAEPDPLVWFAGGPGDAATDAIPGMLSALSVVNDKRDLVFIDQRGTGQSNPLTCPAFPDSSDRSRLRNAVASCLKGLPGDLRFYTTAMFVDDVADVLDALGYRTANLMGISYGTTAEQVMALRHPDRVRTMTLFSGSPLDVALFERFPGNAQAALDRVFARCDRYTACHAAFPHLTADWARLWSSLSEAPWVLPADRSPVGKELRVGTGEMASLLNRLLRSSDTAADIPLLVHTLATSTDHADALAAVVRAGGPDRSQSGDSQPMVTYPIMCDEPWERFRPEALAGQRASFEYRADLAAARWWRQVCPLFPRAPAAAVGAVRLQPSQVPVLALNGEADPVEQPANMTGVGRLWPNSRHLVEPGQGHDLGGDSWGFCLSSLTADFIESADPEKVDAGCLDDVPLPPFPTSLAAVG